MGNARCMICNSKFTQTISKDHKLDRLTRNFALIECKDCNHVMVDNPPTIEELDEYYKNIFWNEKTIEIDPYIQWKKLLTITPGSYERYIRAKHQFKFINSKLSLKKETKIIDIGSGLSPILYYFSKHNFQNLAALELDEKVCSFLKKNNVITKNCKLEYLAKSSQKYDLIILSHTLEHVHNPNEFIALIKELSKEDTKLFIEVPYQDYKDPFNENIHLHFFSLESLKKALSKSNFNLSHYEIDRQNYLDKILLNVLYYLYGQLYSKKNRSINKNSKIMNALHKVWRIFKVLTRSKINIFISRKDIRILGTQKTL